MSDTQLFGKTVKGSFLAVCLYAGADLFTSTGHELMTKTPEEWSAMSSVQIAGYVLSKLGSLFILIKAFYSNSSNK